MKTIGAEVEGLMFTEDIQTVWATHEVEESTTGELWPRYFEHRPFESLVSLSSAVSESTRLAAKKTRKLLSQKSNAK